MTDTNSETDRVTVYRARRSFRFGGGERIDTDELVFDPPEWAVENLESQLERLDVDGRIPESTLRRLHYSRLRRVAAEGDVEGVDGNSAPEDIVAAYALEDDGEADGEEE